MAALPLDVFAEQWLDGELYRQRRECGDLYQRSQCGPLFYLFGSTVFPLTFGHIPDLPLVAWLPALLYAILAFLRWRHQVPDVDTDCDGYRRWRLRHWLLIDLAGLLWGGHVIAAAWILPGASVPLFFALLCTVSFASAICHTFTMHRGNAIAAMTCLMLPSIAGLVILVPQEPFLLISLMGYGVYGFWALDRSNHDYSAQIDAEHALILARAQTERLVRTDALTGLANRREYEYRFEQAWHGAERQQANLALLVLDLDNFKRLNDTYGHPAGDACLRHFGELITRHFRRAGDLAARIGGEEFAVILPGLKAEEAAILGEEFRRVLSESRCIYEDKVIQITASIGAGSVDWLIDRSPVATFARVDQACYQAKRQGRSRLVAA